MGAWHYYFHIRAYRTRVFFIDGVNGPISAGAVLKPLHFPGAVGVDGLPEGIASLDMMFAAGMVPTASQIPIMPTFNCDNLAIGT
jgi:hypothetical protein